MTQVTQARRPPASQKIRGTWDQAAFPKTLLTKAQEITKSFFDANKPTAVICHGPYTLVSAGVVKGRHLTGYWYDGVPEEIEAAGGHYEDKEVVVDGNLVTSRWPADLPAFMRETMKMIEHHQK